MCTFHVWISSPADGITPRWNHTLLQTALKSFSADVEQEAMAAAEAEAADSRELTNADAAAAPEPLAATTMAQRLGLAGLVCIVP